MFTEYLREITSKQIYGRKHIKGLFVNNNVLFIVITDFTG